MDQAKPCARLCHITKWDDFDGYGFNLHAEKGKSGQFIGKVDEGSPSEAAGLRQGDRIIEVNEINIANETHKQVVERIKAFPQETKLLVVDHQADEYYKANNLPIKGTMPGIKYMKTPERSIDSSAEDEKDGLSADGPIHDSITRKSNGSSASFEQPQQISAATSDTHSLASSSGGDTNSTHQQQQQQQQQLHSQENGNGSSISARHNDEDEDNRSNKSATSSSGGSGVIKGATSNGNSSGGGSSGTLNLTMSAKELRAQLAMRKKYDPKKETLGFKDKFDIVQKL